VNGKREQERVWGREERDGKEKTAQVPRVVRDGGFASGVKWKICVLSSAEASWRGDNVPGQVVHAYAPLQRR
jgi:hypothetical protein